METSVLTKVLDGVKFSKECKLSGGKLKGEYRVNLTADFTGLTVGTALQSLAMPTVVINFQRARDTMSEEQVKGLVKTGYTVKALEAGKAYKDPAEEMLKAWPSMTQEAKDNFLRSLGEKK